MQKLIVNHADTYEDISPTNTTNLITVGITWADPNGSADVYICQFIFAPTTENITKVICFHGDDAASMYKEWYFIEAVIPIIHCTARKHFSTKPWNIASLTTLHIWTNQILFTLVLMVLSVIDHEIFVLNNFC